MKVEVKLAGAQWNRFVLDREEAFSNDDYSRGGDDQLFPSDVKMMRRSQNSKARLNSKYWSTAAAAVVILAPLSLLWLPIDAVLTCSSMLKNKMQFYWVWYFSLWGLPFDGSLFHSIACKVRNQSCRCVWRLNSVEWPSRLKNFDFSAEWARENRVHWTSPVTIVQDKWFRMGNNTTA